MKGPSRAVIARRRELKAARRRKRQRKTPLGRYWDRRHRKQANQDPGLKAFGNIPGGVARRPGRPVKR